MSDKKLTFLPADNVGDTKIGFTVREFLGAEILQGEPPNLIEIPNTELLVPGQVIYVPTIMGGYCKMTVDKETDSASDEYNVAFLQPADDGRDVWISTGMANLRGIKKMQISTSGM